MSTDDDVIDFDVAGWMTLDGKFAIEEADVHADGMKWRVHKNDMDPFPSSPHAHCIGGTKRYVGCKLHLGTGVLYDGRRPWKAMDRDEFARLIEKIRGKFPDIELPIAPSSSSDNDGR